MKDIVPLPGLSAGKFHRIFININYSAAVTFLSVNALWILQSSSPPTIQNAILYCNHSLAVKCNFRRDYPLW
jgi:hypothetical protein